MLDCYYYIKIYVFCEPTWASLVRWTESFSTINVQFNNVIVTERTIFKTVHFHLVFSRWEERFWILLRHQLSCDWYLKLTGWRKKLIVYGLLSNSLLKNKSVWLVIWAFTQSLRWFVLYLCYLSLWLAIDPRPIVKMGYCLCLLLVVTIDHELKTTNHFKDWMKFHLKIKILGRYLGKLKKFAGNGRSHASVFRSTMMSMVVRGL